MSSCLHFNRFASLLRPLFACAMLVPVAAPGWEQGGPNDDGYTEEPMFWSRPGTGRKFELGPVGVTGLVIDIEVGKVLTVRETMADTPASGKFRPGEVLTAVNGTAFEGRDPQRLLGEALTAAEAADGRMVFQVRGEDGKPREVALTIPVSGPYQPTWPLDCAKSDAIVKGAAAYYGSDAFLKGPHCKSHSLEGALGCFSCSRPATTLTCPAFISHSLAP